MARRERPQRHGPAGAHPVLGAAAQLEAAGARAQAFAAVAAAVHAAAVRQAPPARRRLHGAAPRTCRRPRCYDGPRDSGHRRIHGMHRMHLCRRRFSALAVCVHLASAALDRCTRPPEGPHSSYSPLSLLAGTKQRRAELACAAAAAGAGAGACAARLRRPGHGPLETAGHGPRAAREPLQSGPLQRLCSEPLQSGVS